MRIAVFVGTRADLGPLEPVIERFVANGDETHILCGVAFDRSTILTLLSHIRGLNVHELALPMQAVTATSMLSQGAQMLDGLNALFAEIQFDAIVVLGDRWELLSVVPAAFLTGVRVVHIHGGEITEGAIDERVRHAVTKLADVHCVASADAASRVQQMGEPADRIFVTGAPGLDRIANAPAATAEEMQLLLGRDVVRPIALFTYHPPTAAEGAPLGEWTTSALEATAEVCGTVIITDPGMDEGREQILEAIEGFAAAEPKAVHISSLGRRYPSVLRAVDVVVGNSSSGVIEAASAGVPAVDIGSRQAGRLRAESVLHAEDADGSVGRALKVALGDEMKARISATVNPYGSANAAAKVVAAAHRAPEFGFQKTFVEM
jgi:UDP-N-acetylglucosamine 2-epimerase (non-hydrolysing)